MLSKRILTILPVLIAAILWGCSEKDQIRAPGVSNVEDVEETGLRPDQQIRGARIELFDGPRKTTDIHADYIEKYTKQDSTLAWGLDVYFYDRDGNKTSHLIADSGLIRESIKWMVTNGNVVVITEDSSRLETEQLFWIGMEDKIDTEKFVTLIQDGDTLTGYGIEAYQPFKGFKIKRQARGTLKDTEALEE
jgi:LPS export ABC transporter protein LptC